MLFARVLVVLLFRSMGCRQCNVTAFRSPLPVCSRSSHKRSPISLDGANSKDDDESVETTPEHHHVQRLDESMMLYYRVSQGIEDDGDDAIAQRKDELTRLIEDLVFEENGIVRESAQDTTTTTTAAADNSSQKETTTKMDSSSSSSSSMSLVEELSLALDKQILLGSQSTFTEDELKEWVAKIDELRNKIVEAQLIALPASTSSTTTKATTTTPSKADDTGSEASEESETKTTTTTTTGTSTVEELQQRLESVRTSIEHVGSNI